MVVKSLYQSAIIVVHGDLRFNFARVQEDVLVENELHSDVLFSKFRQKLFFVAVIIKLGTALANRTAGALDLAVRNEHP